MAEKGTNVRVLRKSPVRGLLAVLIYSGCTAATLPIASDGSDQELNAEASIGELLDKADATQGRRLFLQCRACHSLEKNGINSVGPNLHGFMGKTAGQAKGFLYSDVLADSGVVWTPETLDQWLARPGNFLPGNRMIFAGIQDPRERADLILYLQQATAPAD